MKSGKSIKAIAELAAAMAARKVESEQQRHDKARKGKKGGRPRNPSKATRAKPLKGSIGTRMAHARPLLSAADRARLEILVITSPKRLAELGLIDLGRHGDADPEIVVNMEREALFAKAEGARNARERKDPIGRAWHEGLLDGHGADPVVLRELGREYGYLYWGELRKLDCGIAHYEGGAGRSRGRKFFMGGLTGWEAARFQDFEDALQPLGAETRQALQKLCVDEIWFPEGPAWLDRLINAERIRRSGDSIAGELPRRGDSETMRLAVKALITLATEVPQRRQAA